MTEPKLHLDADASKKAIKKALITLDHDVTRTPCVWMPLDASDESQLLGAAVQGRCLFTYNVRDFITLAARHPRHGGIILLAQNSLSLSEQIQALHRMFCTTQAEYWPGQIRWLTDWKEHR